MAIGFCVDSVETCEERRVLDDVRLYGGICVWSCVCEDDNRIGQDLAETYVNREREQASRCYW